MSSNYSANQYESSYQSERLQNWSVSQPCRQRPAALEGHTVFIADDRGHLLPGVSKRGSSWPAFKGTWDLPARLPPPGLNPTSRSVDGWNRLQALRGDPERTRTAQPREGSADAPRHQAEHDAQQDSSATDPTPPPPAQSKDPPGCSGAEGPTDPTPPPPAQSQDPPTSQEGRLPQRD